MRLLNAMLSVLVLTLAFLTPQAVAKVFAHGVNEGPKRILVPVSEHDPNPPDLTDTGDTSTPGDGSGDGSTTDTGVTGLGDAIATPCPADVTGDGLVDVLDLVAVFELWGPCDGTCAADTNDDLVVDVMDLIDVITGWGVCAP